MIRSDGRILSNPVIILYHLKSVYTIPKGELLCVDSIDLICRQRAALTTVCCRQLIIILDEGQHLDQLIWGFSHLSLMNTSKMID